MVLFSDRIKEWFSHHSMDFWVRVTQIVVNVVTTIALIVTFVYTNSFLNDQLYNENQNFAVSLYKDYSSLVLEKNNRQFSDSLFISGLEKFSFDIKNDSSKANICDEYKYFVGFVLYYAESIYNIMNENEAWVNTVEYMIQPHYKYIVFGKLLDKAYSKDFRDFCNSYFSELEQSEQQKGRIKNTVTVK